MATKDAGSTKDYGLLYGEPSPIFPKEETGIKLSYNVATMIYSEGGKPEKSSLKIMSAKFIPDMEYPLTFGKGGGIDKESKEVKPDKLFTLTVTGEEISGLAEAIAEVKRRREALIAKVSQIAGETSARVRERTSQPDDYTVIVQPAKAKAHKAKAKAHK